MQGVSENSSTGQGASERQGKQRNQLGKGKKRDFPSCVNECQKPGLHARAYRCKALRRFCKNSLFLLPPNVLGGSLSTQGRKVTREEEREVGLKEKVEGEG